MKSILLSLLLVLGLPVFGQQTVGLPIYENGSLAFTNFFATNVPYLGKVSPLRVASLDKLLAVEMSALLSSLSHFTLSTRGQVLSADGIELTVLVDGYYVPGDSGGGVYCFTTDLSQTNAYGGKLAVSGGAWQLILDKGESSIAQFGAVPTFLTYYTNNGNASQIPIDSTARIQAASDYLSAIGGGVLNFPPGDYKVLTIYTRPRVAYRGASPVTGFEGNALMPESGPQARVAGQSVIHGIADAANGQGAPLFVMDGPTYYTNVSTACFTSLDQDTICYREGVNSFENLSFMPGYRWAWDGGYPTAGIIINQVGGTRISKCNFQTIAGVAVYILGGRGTIVEDCLMRGCSVAGTFITVTSDAEFVGNIYNNGSAHAMLHQANTITFRNNQMWNTREDLVRYSGAVTIETQFGQSRGFATPRTGWAASTTDDTLSVPSGIGLDTGLPILIRGTSLPGGLDTNKVYYARFTTTNTTAWYLTTSAYKALLTTNRVDITSAGGAGTWWCETLSGGIAAYDGEEIYAIGNRMDQQWNQSVVLHDIRRATIQDQQSWEIGYDQTGARFNTRGTNRMVAGIELYRSSDVLVTGNEILGSFNVSAGTYPLVYDYSGVDIYQSGNVSIAGNQFNWLDQAVRVDNLSSGIAVKDDIGLYANRLVKSASPSVPTRFPGALFRGTNYIRGTVPSAYTNVAGDYSVSLNLDVPSAQANNTYIPLFVLSPTNNPTGFTPDSAVQPYCLVAFMYMSTTNASLTMRHYGSAGNWVDRTYIATEWLGKSARLTMQRAAGVGEIWLDGVKMTASLGGNGTIPAESDPMDWKYIFLGPWVNNIYATNRMFHFAGHVGKSFTGTEINRGQNFAQMGGQVWNWDFRTASGTTVPDVSGSGVTGTVYNLDAANPIIFGSWLEFVPTLAFYDTTEAVEILNTAQETSLFPVPVTLPADVLDTDATDLLLKIPFKFLNNSGAERQITFRVKVNGVTVFEKRTGNLPTGPTPRVGIMRLVVQRSAPTIANGSVELVLTSTTTSGVGAGSFDVTPTVGAGAFEAATWDWTSPNTFDVTAEFSDATPTIQLVTFGATVRK